jgi:hypothetical protein
VELHSNQNHEDSAIERTGLSQRVHFISMSGQGTGEAFCVNAPGVRQLRRDDNRQTGQTASSAGGCMGT